MIQNKMMDTDVTLEPATTEIESMWNIVDSYRRHFYLKPPHQRERVWDKDKIANWIVRLKSKIQPVGVIVTYQIDNGFPSPIYLNDGFQRITSTMEYLDNPGKFGNTDDEAERICRSCKMPREHRLYPDHDFALMDFQNLNLGTALTPFEFCKGVLTYMPRYSEWEPILDELHSVLPGLEGRVSVRRFKINRENQHKLSRMDFSMLHRFLTESIDMTDYNVGQTQVKPSDASSRTVVEWRLREVLSKSDIESVRDSIRKFNALAERETALMEELWFGRMQKDRGKGISPTLYRWMIDCAIWKRNAKIPQAVWEDFVYKVLVCSDGLSQIVNENEKRRYTLNLARLSQLKGVCAIVGSDMYAHKPSKRARSTAKLRTGYDNSHLQPFSVHGEGETAPESAGRNRARGAKPWREFEPEARAITPWNEFKTELIEDGLLDAEDPKQDGE